MILIVQETHNCDSNEIIGHRSSGHVGSHLPRVNIIDVFNNNDLKKYSKVLFCWQLEGLPLLSPIRKFCRSFFKNRTVYYWYKLLVKAFTASKSRLGALIFKIEFILWQKKHYILVAFNIYLLNDSIAKWFTPIHVFCDNWYCSAECSCFYYGSML